MAVALVAAGCGSHHAARTAAKPSSNLGAPTIQAALARFRTALTQENGHEACLLLYPTPTLCAHQESLPPGHLGSISTRIISSRGTGEQTKVVLETVVRHGQTVFRHRDSYGFTYRQGRWFIGSIEG